MRRESGPETIHIDLREAVDRIGGEWGDIWRGYRKAPVPSPCIHQTTHSPEIELHPDKKLPEICFAETSQSPSGSPVPLLQPIRRENHHSHRWPAPGCFQILTGHKR